MPRADVTTTGGRFIARARGLRRWDSVLVALSYAIVFAVLGWPWLRAMDRAIPVGPPLVSAGDGQVFTWTLALVTHALGADPAHLFDANVFHPAPGQLTGGEHFLSSQIVFAPLYLSSGNALWSASMLAWLSYPLAAWAMDRCLRACGCRASTAWSVGLLFALGPLRVPASLQVIQYLNAYLPLGALSVTRLRDRPTAARTVVLTLVLTLGILSSYYLALMLAAALVPWTLLEARSPAAGRWRFLACLGLAVGAAVLAAVPMTLPYLGRAEVGAPHATDFTWQSVRLYQEFRDTPGVEEMVQTMGANAAADPTFTGSPEQIVMLVARAVLRFVPRWLGIVGLVLSILGLAALWSSRPPVRGLACRGLLVCGVGLALMGFLVLILSGQCQACYVVPLQFFRFPWRLAVVVGFGMALCAAAALEMVADRLGTTDGTAIGALVALCVVGVDGSRLLESGLQAAAAQQRPIYERVREVAQRESSAPLLELPLADPRGASFEWEAMLGSTRHWLPLVTGIRSYPPPHAEALAAAIELLPDESALARLVDMTHVRWLLLRPARDWSHPEVRSALLERPDITVVAEEEEWSLARVDREPDEPGPFAAIARGRPPQ